MVTPIWRARQPRAINGGDGTLFNDLPGRRRRHGRALPVLDGGDARRFGNFPFGTLGVNVLGSFLASVIMVLALEKSALSHDMRLILVTGMLGGFTTYSSFNYETLHLAQSGATQLAIVNVLVTLVACLGAGIAGIRRGRRGPRGRGSACRPRRRCWRR